MQGTSRPCGFKMTLTKANDPNSTQNEHRKIVFLNRSYWPDVEATGQLLTELCESLSDEFRISVVAGKPNQLSNPATDADWPQVTRRNGVEIRRINHLQLPKGRMATKAINYLSFVRATRKQLKSIDPPDAVVFETDPFLLPFEAAKLQRRTGCRVIGYLQDIYPDVAVALGKVPNNWPIRKLRASLFDVYRRCDRMVVLSEDMKRLLVDGGVSPQRISIVPNWADTKQIVPIGHSENAFRRRHNLKDTFLVMYSGNLGLTQRLEEFVEAARLLQNDPEILFAFVGQGSQKKSLEDLVKQLQLTNVRFFDYQPKAELAHSLSAADLHLVPLTQELSQCLMPSKLYGILASGRPYLTNAVPESELHQITVSQNLGLTVVPGKPEAIALAIQQISREPKLLQTMGENGRRLAESQYTLSSSASKFRQVLQEAMA